MSTPTLDLSRPHGIYSEKVGDEVRRYIGQDGRRFTCDTHDYVPPDQSAGPAKESGSPPEKPKPTNVLKCKACGKTYKLGPTAATQALAQKRMKDHLRQAHGVELGDQPL